MASEGAKGEQPPPLQTLLTAGHGSVETVREHTRTYGFLFNIFSNKHAIARKGLRYDAVLQIYRRATAQLPQNPSEPVG